MAVLATGCNALSGVAATPMPEGQLVSDCAPPLAFEGETTLEAIGLGHLADEIGNDVTRHGSIRVTRHIVTWEQFAPPEVSRIGEDGQMLCVTWPDGSGMTMLLQEPFGEAAEEDRAAGSGQPPVGPLLVVVVVLAMTGVAWLAFRERRA